MDGQPPKFKPFKRTRVVLALEPTPQLVDQKTDITAFVPKPFTTGLTDADVDVADLTAAAAPVTGLDEPAMFKKKRGKKADYDDEPLGIDIVKREKKVPSTALPDVLLRATLGAKKTKVKVSGEPTVYSRFDVLSREQQAAEIAKLPDTLQADAKVLLDVETENPYEIEPVPEVFAPMSRRGFGSFLIDNYGPIFPKKGERKLDVATCAAKGDEGVKEVKIYHYQAFIREYLRFETPYRGLLVYHGLGSGKTCSAIAAAEALFGTRGSKIIVMTPYSLRDNFISEINFCGFKHFRLQNHWTALSLLPGSTPEPGMVKLFAQNVYGIPESYFAKRARGRSQLSRIWIPDFEEAPNFDSLGPEEKDEIQTQLKMTIENRIKFINYNGITARELKLMVCSTPEVFDNAVIVVDEVHNLTRLMQGSLERPFTKARPLEVITPDRKPLPLCGMSAKYERGYLFYRLFMDAKNTKIIGLSGTPLINFPEELGILMNILHGPNRTIEFTVAVEAMREVKDEIEKIVRLNEDLDTVFFQASEGSIAVTVTRLPEQFTKVLDDEGDILGIRRRDPGQSVPTLDAVWAKVAVELAAKKIRIGSAPAFKAYELLPSWDTPFRGAFLQEDGITLKNSLVLQKRIRGLISYYRGIQGDVMPKVIKDEIVGIPLSGYSLKIYNKMRNQEIQIEMSKPKADLSAADAIWNEIEDISKMKSSSNYRMSSRQACNFVFPEGITRPRPRDAGEQDVETGTDRDAIIDADVEDGVAGRDEDAASVVDEDDLEAKAAAGIARPVLSGKEQKEAYKNAIKLAKSKLREMGPTHLQLDGPAEHNLARYSPKFAAMIKKIGDLPGSSLVYSTFLEMEGIGILGICMEANGYVPIEIVAGGDGKLKFSDRTAASLAKGPKVKENRYIEFTGVGSKEQRGAAVNVFNSRLDKMSPAMEKVLKDAGWTDNLDGGLCRVFCITSAGAEGLSLKAVRGVHIMEPYWNTVRTQQVKGRAVRICSHMELAKEQQNVEIYTYCTMIPDEAVIAQAIDKTLERSDTFSAKDAAALGVPVPAPAKKGVAIEDGMFFKVEDKGPEPVPVGAQATTEGPVKFYVKLVNEYRGFTTFAPSPIVIGGKRYPTLEHYVQAMRFPGDPMWQEAIRVSADPKKARQLGTDPAHTVRPDWDTVKEAVMLEGLREKFRQNRGLLELLKATGARPLVEASPDPFWGEGRTGKGKNRYGKLLEQVRTELKEYVVPAAVGDQAPPKDVDFYESDDAAEAEANDAAEAEANDAAEAEADDALAKPDELVPEQAGGAGADGEATEDQDNERTIILTSDQKVLLIGLRKEKVIGSLQTLMKTVSVDCQLNYEDNNDGTYKCLSLGDSIGDFAYHPILEKDIKETEARFGKKTAAPTAAPAQVAMAAPAPSAALLEAAGLAPPTAAPPTAAAPTVPPVAEAAPRPLLKKITYRKKDYRYKIKMGETMPAGYILYEFEDIYGDKPIGYITADAKGLPKGDIGPVP
jgi:N-glycosidase YbiA